MNPIAMLIDAAIPSVSLRFSLRRALQIRREREALAKLTPAQLRDIGIEPGEAYRETQRGFLDLPVRR